MRRPISVLLLWAVLASASPVEAATGADLYVSASGSDGNPGTEQAPFRSIARAALAAGPGTTVHVAPGTYDGGFVTRTSGTADEPIRYVSTEKWGAKIVPPASSSTKIAWENRGAYVRIDGFEVDGREHRGGAYWRFGLYTAGDHSAIVNSRVHDLAWDSGVRSDANGGAGIGGDGYYGAVDITVAGNLVHDIGPRTDSSNRVHGIYITTTGTVTGNEVYGIAGTAIHLWHDARQVVISGNTVSNAKFGILVGGGDYVTTRGPNDDTVVTDNAVNNSRVCGIAEQGDTGPNNRYAGNRLSGNGRDLCLLTGAADVRPAAMRGK